jgi:capsular exopolysaccharide synthesis family protein
MKEKEELKEEAQTLQDYMQTISKHKLLILSCVVLVLVLAAISLINSEPVFRAESRLLIEQKAPRVIEVAEVAPSNPETLDYFESQLDILESPTLAREVIENLRLYDHPNFISKPNFSVSPIKIMDKVLDPLINTISKLFSHEDTLTVQGTDDPIFPFLKQYFKGLKVRSRRKSRVITISFESLDPALTARVANEHADAYIARYTQMKLSASDAAAKWLQDQLYGAREKLRESEESLQAFQEKEKIVYLSSISSPGDEGREETILARKLGELNASVESTRTERIGLETLVSQLRKLSKTPGMVEAIPDIIENDLLRNLKGEYVTLTREFLEVKEKFGERHPRRIALQNELESLKNRIASEVAKVARSLEVKLHVARSKEEAVLSALEDTKEESMDLRKKAIRFSMLKQEVASNRKIYDMLLQRANETSLTRGLSATNLFILDRAQVPQVPFKPRRNFILMTALAAGLILGISMALLVDYMDNTFHGPDEVKKSLAIPFLGPVSMASNNNKGITEPIELWVLQDPWSQFAECIRNVRTNIMFCSIEGDRKVFVITSTSPSEGKTLIASNLAVLMAQMGQKVLLVDADLRKPRVHNIFGLAGEPGLSNMILEKRYMGDMIKRTEVEGLKVLPAGTLPVNPAEVLGSSWTKKLIERFKKQHDFVLLDTPPILSATDSSMLGGMIVDGSIMVIQASKTKRIDARRALEHLTDAGASVMGAVLNRVDFRKERYHYSYYSKYYSYYSTKDGKKPQRILDSTRSLPSSKAGTVLQKGAKESSIKIGEKEWWTAKNRRGRTYYRDPDTGSTYYRKLTRTNI